jgi:hypothetical protein
MDANDADNNATSNVISRREFLKLLGIGSFVSAGTLFFPMSISSAIQNVFAQNSTSKKQETKGKLTLKYYPYLHIRHATYDPRLTDVFIRGSFLTLREEMPSNEPFIVYNNGNLPSWSCNVEVYGHVYLDWPPPVGPVAGREDRPIRTLSDLRLIGKKTISVQPGEAKEVFIPVNWDIVSQRTDYFKTLMAAICYDPVFDPLGPLDSIRINETFLLNSRSRKVYLLYTAFHPWPPR